MVDESSSSLASMSASMASSSLVTGVSDHAEPVHPLIDDFKCSKCFSLIREPHLTSCGHHFCKQCIEPALRQAAKRCPVCHESGIQTMADKALERKIKVLDVYCSNREVGCEWVGKYDSLQEHVQGECDFVLVSCTLAPFGCKLQVPRKHLDAHVNDVLGHVSTVMDHFDAQQQTLEHTLVVVDAQTKQLEKYIDEVEANLTVEAGKKSSIKWTPVPSYPLLRVKVGDYNGVYSCNIPPEVVPDTAKEILVYGGVHAGNANGTGGTYCITLYVEEDGVRYAKYIHVTTYRQDAYNDNTDNMSFPMPSNRRLHMDVPVAFTGHLWIVISLNGYC